MVQHFHLLKNILSFSPVVLKGIYHYWKYIFPGVSTKWKKRSGTRKPCSCHLRRRVAPAGSAASVPHAPGAGGWGDGGNSRCPFHPAASRTRRQQRSAQVSSFWDIPKLPPLPRPRGETRQKRGGPTKADSAEMELSWANVSPGIFGGP